jgi:hypothetical protein
MLWSQPFLIMFVSLEDFSLFLMIEKSRLNLVKNGRIYIHETTSKAKNYVRGKIILKNDKNIGDRYQLFEVENLYLIERNKQHTKGKGYIISKNNL